MKPRKNGARLLGGEGDCGDAGGGEGVRDGVVRGGGDVGGFGGDVVGFCEGVVGVDVGVGKHFGCGGAEVEAGQVECGGERAVVMRVGDGERQDVAFA